MIQPVNLGQNSFVFLFQRVVWLPPTESSCQWHVVTELWTTPWILPVIPGEIGGRHRGALVSIDNGKATTYSIMSIEERGTIVNPGTEAYEGMIIGENSWERLTVNILESKQMTNACSATMTNSGHQDSYLDLEESLSSWTRWYMVQHLNSIRL